MKANIKITIERIMAYLRQTLTNRERHDLERDVMRDPFDEEAFEGLNQLSADEAEADIRKIKDRLTQRTRKERTWWAHPAFRIAAAVVLLIGMSVVIQVIVKNNFKDQQIGEVTEKETSPETRDTTQDRKEEKVSTKVPSKKEADINNLAENKQEDKIREEQEMLAEPDEEIKEKDEGEPATSRPKQKTAIKDKEQSDSSELLFSEQVVITGDAEAEQAITSLRSAKGQQAKSTDQVITTDKHAQMIKGRVMTKEGEPIPGVNIVEKGTNNGTVSDIAGAFELEMEDTSHVLVFSFIGYSEEQVASSDVGNDTIVMSEELMALEEVVVVGYGVQKKSEPTGAVSKVEPDEIELDGRKVYIGPIPPTETIRQFRKDVEQAVKAKQVEGLENVRKVVIHFVVYEDGTLGDFEFKHEINEHLQQEIIKSMKAQGIWKPATMDHSALDTRMRLRLRFR